MENNKNKNIKCNICGIPLKRKQLFKVRFHRDFYVYSVSSDKYVEKPEIVFYCHTCFSKYIRNIMLRNFQLSLKEMSDEAVIKSVGG